MKQLLVVLVAGLLAVGAATAGDYGGKKDETEKALKEAKSQAINEIKYDADSKKLTVAFDRGTYEYADVPEEVYKAFAESESQGVYYRENIRGKYKSAKVKAKE